MNNQSKSVKEHNINLTISDIKNKVEDNLEKNFDKGENALSNFYNEEIQINNNGENQINTDEEIQVNTNEENQVNTDEEIQTNIIENNTNTYNNSCYKSVMSIDENGNIEIFDSIREAAVKNNIKTPGNISLVCNGKRNSAGGKIWEYLITEPELEFNNSWKRFRESNVYFSRTSNKYYNKTKKRFSSGGKSGRININIGGFLFKEALWETFNGPIPENYDVRYKKKDDGNFLSNLYIQDNICKLEECSNVFQRNQKWQDFCSEQCKYIHRNRINYQKEKVKLSNNLRYYLEEKIRSGIRSGKWNKNINVDILLIDDELGFNDRTCVYCGLKNLSLRNDDPFCPDKLHIDHKDPSKKGKDFNKNKKNLVACCGFCNLMKHTQPLNMWNKLLGFLKGEVSILDISDAKYVRDDELVSKNSHIKPWDTIKSEAKKLKHTFPKGVDGKIHFKNLYESQNKFDSIFGLFPLIHLISFSKSIPHPLTVSCDKIEPNKPKWQLLPLFLNLAKNKMSMEELMDHLKKRNYLQNTANQKVILPKDYNKNSHYLKKMYGLTSGKGHNGMKRSQRTKDNISKSKIGKKIGFNSVSGKAVTAMCIKDNKEYKFGSIRQAIINLGLPKNCNSNGYINRAAKNKTEYLGYFWKFN